MKFIVYILQSEIDASFYIGHIYNLEKRLKEHNSGMTRYTAKKRPWKVVYKEIYNTKTEALKRERFLKKQRNTDFYQSLIDSQKRLIK